MSYKLTVIIPTYNSELNILPSIESVINQSIGFENIELILVDDGSTDSTRNILNEYSRKYENIKCFFPKEHCGNAGRGRNIGINNSTSNYIMFLDSDDYFIKNICEVLFNTITKYDKDIVMCNHKVIKNGDFSIAKDIKQDFTISFYDPQKDETIFNNGYMWNKIFKKEYLNKYNIRCPENFICEDLVFGIEAFLYTPEIIFLNKYYGYLYNVRDSKTNYSTMNKANLRKFNETLEAFYKSVEILKNHEKEDLIKFILKNQFTTLISLFIRLDIDRKTKIKCLEELYEFKKYANLYYPINENWAEFFNKNIEKRNFSFLIIYSKFLNYLYNSKGIRELYRKIYKNYD